MDASRKEAVQRGIVHLQQRFHICTENGKVISVLSIIFPICCILFPFIFPLVPDKLTAGIVSSGYKNAVRSGIFHLMYLCMQPQHQ